MSEQRPDGDRKRLLAVTDDLLARIEELRLADQIKVPDALRSRLAAVSAAMDQRLHVPTTLADAHDHVFRLQTRLVRASTRAPRPQPVPGMPPPSRDAQPLTIPARESGRTEAEWLELVRLTVQRARDRARYLSAQADAAEGSPFAEHLVGTRREQAADAQRAFSELARDARRITGGPVPLDPPIAQPESGRYEVGEVVFDFDRPDVLLRGQPVRLTVHERRILAVLADNAGRVVTREALQHAATRADPLLNLRSTALAVHISTLRSKLGRGYIEAVRGIGYRMPAELTAPATDRDQARQVRRAERSAQVRRSADGGATSPPLPPHRPNDRPSRP